MNTCHLGDALDFWKGRIIALLKRHLHSLHVVPMFTDGIWNEDLIRQYAFLLGDGNVTIVRPETSFTRGHRNGYFEEISMNNPDLGKHVNDLFVDPDTGVQSKPKSRAKPKHIKICEIAPFLEEASTRVMLIYQHRQRGDKNWLKHCLMRVTRRALSGCHAFAYDAGEAAMIFVSRDRGRLDTMRNALGAVLPGGRITRKYGTG